MIRNDARLGFSADLYKVVNVLSHYKNEQVLCSHGRVGIKKLCETAVENGFGTSDTIHLKYIENNNNPAVEKLLRSPYGERGKSFAKFIRFCLGERRLAHKGITDKFLLHLDSEGLKKLDDILI